MLSLFAPPLRTPSMSRGWCAARLFFRAPQTPQRVRKTAGLPPPLSRLSRRFAPRRRRGESLFEPGLRIRPPILLPPSRF
jgi:hypothetical protein